MTVELTGMHSCKSLQDTHPGDKSCPVPEPRRVVCVCVCVCVCAKDKRFWAACLGAGSMGTMNVLHLSLGSDLHGSQH